MAVKWPAWSDEEDDILEEVYPKAGPGATRLVLASHGYRRSYNEVRCRARFLGLRRSGAKAERSYIHQHGAALPAILNRPLTPTSVEIIHWYARRGRTPQETAADINRPIEIVERILREIPPPLGRDNLWPSSHADWGLA